MKKLPFLNQSVYCTIIAFFAFFVNHSSLGSAKCCDWCADVSGKYTLDSAPAGIWGRHDNCKCSIQYDAKKGGRQLLRGTSKKWEKVAPGAGAGELVVLTEEQAAVSGAGKATVLTSEQAEALRAKHALTKKQKDGIIETDRMAAQNDSDVIRWLPKGKELTSDQRRKLTDYAAGYGIVLTGLKHTDVDIELMKETIDAAASMLNIFPELNRPDLPFTIKIVNGMDSRDFAMTTKRKDINVVQLNANAFRDKEKLAEEYEKLVKEKWFPQGTSYRSIVIHEIGHMYQRYAKIDSSIITKKILPNMSVDDLEQYLSENLSKYSVGGENIFGEIIAGVFNAYYGSSVPNQFAEEFMSYIKRG